MSRDDLLRALGGARHADVTREEFDPISGQRLPSRAVSVTTDLDTLDPDRMLAGPVSPDVLSLLRQGLERRHQCDVAVAKHCEPLPEASRIPRSFDVAALTHWIAQLDGFLSQPEPPKAWCCAHNGACSVHREPYNAEVVACTCTERTSLWRHEWRPGDIRRVSVQGGMQ